MPHDLTEVPAVGAAVTVPDAGDARTAASVNGAFQELANRTRYLLAALANGAMVGGDTVWCYDGASIHISRITAVVLGNKTYATLGETVIDSAWVPGGYTAGTWYFIYAFVNAGSLQFKLTTTPPDRGACVEGTDVNTRYIASVYAISATQVRAFYKADRVTHLIGGPDAERCIIQDLAPGPNTWTGVSLGVSVPPHVREVYVDAFVSSDNNNGLGTVSLALGPGGTGFIHSS